MATPQENYAKAEQLLSVVEENCTEPAYIQFNILLRARLYASMALANT